jgi:Trm5-related predicted tRNA methylase
VESFEQAIIKVEKETEFEQLRSAIARVFAPQKVEKLLTELKKRSLRVRDWDSVLSKEVLEKVDESLRQSGKTARGLYEQITVSDRAQIREFYLFRVEEVDPKLREKFHGLYQYY